LFRRAPRREEIARRAGVDCVVEFAEVPDPLHRVHRRTGQHQDALEDGERHAGRACSDHHGLAGRIVENPVAQARRRIDQPFEIARKRTGPVAPRIDVDAHVKAFVLRHRRTAAAGGRRRQHCPPRGRRGGKERLAELGGQQAARPLRAFLAGTARVRTGPGRMLPGAPVRFTGAACSSTGLAAVSVQVVSPGAVSLQTVSRSIVSPKGVSLNDVCRCTEAVDHRRRDVRMAAQSRGSRGTGSGARPVGQAQRQRRELLLLLRAVV